MTSYLLKRLIYMVLTIIAISIVSFIIIQLPPGDFLTAYIASLSASGANVDQEVIQALRIRYNLDQPIYVQYFRWIKGFVHGDFGESFNWEMPVSKLLRIRLPLTIIISLITLVFTYLVSVPIGIYSATHQYSFFDYVFTTFGFAGLATPNFLFALVLMFVFYKYLGFSVGGLFSPDYIEAAWGIDKFIDLLKHLPIPIIVIGTANTAGLIRVMRATLLDELGKQYVITAKAKGVSDFKLLIKYPVRMALNPIISSLGWILPSLVSGTTITAIVLSLPTVGPLLLNSLKSQDMYLAGTIVLMLSSLVVIGMFLSDLILVWLDPRIKYE